MFPDFDLWFSYVRDHCETRGVNLPKEISEGSLQQWKTQYENKLSPEEAYYNVVELANTQIGFMPNPAD